MARVIIAAVFLCLTGCADDLLLHPSTAPANFGTAQRREIEDHGRTIEVFISQSPACKNNGIADAYDIDFTGNATRAEHIADTVAKHWGEKSVEVWVMNYPGFGGSTGPASLHAIPAAALASYDALAAQAHGKPIIVAGASLGTATALYVAANRPAAAMILQDPPPLQRMILQKYGWVIPAPVVAQIPSELDSVANAKRVKAPAIFILDGRDTTVPPKFSQMVVDDYAGEKHLVRMPDARHNAPITGAAAEEFQHELDWIWNTVREH